MRHYGKLIALTLSLVLLLAVGAPFAGAVSTTTVQVLMEVDKTDALIDGQSGALEAPPILIGDRPYVPLKALGDLLGVKVEWNDKTKLVEMIAPKLKVEFDIDKKEVWINKVKTPFDNIAAMNGGKLLVKLSWFGDMIGAKYQYVPEKKQVEILYVKRPEELSSDSDTSSPVAKFTFAKASYKIGEPVKFIDLSYDPDAEGFAEYTWTGKQDAYFAPGVYPITLKVKDSAGHESKVYSRDLVIENEAYTDAFQYKLQYTPVGESFATDWSEIWGKFWELPMLPKQVNEDRSRKLIVSDSPEEIKEYGILYQEKVNGKARLYADHINGMEEKVQFVIMARNMSTTKPVTIKTTNKGEVYPSIYANIIGHEASVDFMLGDPVKNNTMTVPAGMGYVYVQMPDFYPGQGVNVFYDVETDGEVEFSFVAMHNSITTPISSSLALYKSLDYVANVRGTFPVADMTWNVDLKDVRENRKPARLTIGDNKEDPFVAGFDNQRNKNVLNEGNYGVMYKLHMEKPPKMAIMLLAKGGPFKGPFKLNGEFSMVPHSGVLSAFERVHILGRTTGQEDKLDIEFTPPAGSAFPVDLVFYPLDDLK